jgi:hypothetical protein
MYVHVVAHSEEVVRTHALFDERAVLRPLLMGQWRES